MSTFYPLSSFTKVVGTLGGAPFEKTLPYSTPSKIEDAYLRETFPHVCRRKQENLIRNPTAATATTGWSAYNGGVVTTTLARVTALARPGALDANCFRASRTAGTGNVGMSVGVGSLDIRRDGSPYLWTAWIRSPVGVVVRMYQEYSISGTFYSVESQHVGIGDWLRCTGPLVRWPTESTAGSGSLIIYVAAAATGVIFEVDDIMLSEHDSAYFDASYPGGAWVGTANASTSIRDV